MFSCGEAPLSPEEQAAQTLLDDPRPKLLMTMSSDVELTLNVKKFEETVSHMTFHIIFDPDALEITSYSGGDFGNPWSNMDFMDVNNDSVYCSFHFPSANISGSGELLNLKFHGKSSSSYQESTIYIASIVLEDESGDIIEFSDDNTLYLQNICYIDEGWLISANLPGPLSESWVPTNNYVWSNSYCGY